MISSVSTFADSSSGIGALGIDWKAFIIQLITFLLAFLLLKKYAFTPIAKIMRERRETIESGVQLGEKMKQDQAALEAKIGEELAKARRQADGIVADAQATSRDTIREAEAQAQTKADGIITAAKKRTEQDMARARRDLEGELVDLIADATGAILEEKVDAKKDAQLIDRALKAQARQ